MNTRQVAATLGITRPAVRSLIHAGRLRATRHWFWGWQVTTRSVAEYRLDEMTRARGGADPTGADIDILAARAVVAWAEAAGRPATDEEISTAGKKTSWETK